MSHHDEFNSREEWPAVKNLMGPKKATTSIYSDAIAESIRKWATEEESAFYRRLKEDGDARLARIEYCAQCFKQPGDCACNVPCWVKEWCMNLDPKMSARPCGCDPGLDHLCQRHEEEKQVRELAEQLMKGFEKEEEALASREAIGQKFVTGNGEQIGFSTGATRSIDVDKIDYEGHINPEVQAIYGAYMHRHRIQRDGRVRASDNWQQGIPIYRYVKSLIRHVFEFWRMWRGSEVINPDSGKPFTFEDVLCAIRFNVDGILYEIRNNIAFREGRRLDPIERQQLESVDMPPEGMFNPQPAEVRK